ncbi:MAG: LemA family protein [Bacteroidota bacterium]
MSKGLITTLIVVAGILIVVFGFVSWGTGVYDTAIKKQGVVKQAWGNVQAMYQRRADLIPSLVATVKGAAENEKSILVQVTQARAGIVNATTPEELDRAGKQINTAINLAFEAYPQIKSTENFQELQVELTGSENRIAVARERYNEAVDGEEGYNTYVQGYFKSMALGFFGKGKDFSMKKGFESAEGSDVAPKVDFSTK